MTVSPDTPDFTGDHVIWSPASDDPQLVPTNMLRVIGRLGGVTMPPKIDLALAEGILNQAYTRYREVEEGSGDVDATIISIDEYARGASFYRIAREHDLGKSTPRQRYARFCETLAKHDSGPEFFRALYPEVFTGLQTIDESGRANTANTLPSDQEKTDLIPAERRTLLKKLASNLGLRDENEIAINRYFFMTAEDLVSDNFGPVERMVMQQTLEVMRHELAKSIATANITTRRLTQQDLRLFGIMLGNGRSPAFQYSQLPQIPGLLQRLKLQRSVDLLPAIEAALRHFSAQLHSQR